MEKLIYSNEMTNEMLQFHADNMNENEGVETYTKESSEVIDAALETLSFNFDDEVENLNNKLENRIICIANLGLWNGRTQGYKLLTDNLNSILNKVSYNEYFKVYAENRNVKAVDIHHDGTNYYTFRVIKNEKSIHNLLEKLMNNTATQEDINRYTTSLYKEVKKVYGW